MFQDTNSVHFGLDTFNRLTTGEMNVLLRVSACYYSLINAKPAGEEAFRSFHKAKSPPVDSQHIQGENGYLIEGAT